MTKKLDVSPKGKDVKMPNFRPPDQLQEGYQKSMKDMEKQFSPRPGFWNFTFNR